VARLTATGATGVTVSGATVRATLPPGSTGTAVLAVPATAGWHCAAGDGPSRPADDHHGLIAVPLDGSVTELTCTFRTPGLRTGIAVGGAAALALVLHGTVPALRRARRRTTT
jgi:hypothetical protein